MTQSRLLLLALAVLGLLGATWALWPSESESYGRSGERPATDSIDRTVARATDGEAVEEVQLARTERRSIAPVDVPAAPAVETPPDNLPPEGTQVEAELPTPPQAAPALSVTRRAERTARRKADGKRSLRADEGTEDALKWLAAQQNPDGSWNASGKLDPAVYEADETVAMRTNTEVRVTSLALLAFVEDGHSLVSWPYGGAVRRAADWLASMQDAESGRIGSRAGTAGALDHAYATFALGEVLHASDSEELREVHRASLAALLERKNTGAPLMAVEEEIDIATAIERWDAAVSELESCLEPLARKAMIDAGRNTLTWRYVLHHAFGEGNGAHDIFASFTATVMQRSSAGNAERQTNEILRDQIIEGPSKGSFQSTDARHGPIGPVGVTALHAICLSIAADRMDSAPH